MADAEILCCEELRGPCLDRGDFSSAVCLVPLEILVVATGDRELTVLACLIDLEFWKLADIEFQSKKKLIFIPVP